MTSYGRANGYIWDCVFQELEVKTNALLFEWRASDHFSFEDMTVNSWADWTGTDNDPWDWFHLNSVTKSKDGNYWVTARYTKAVSHIQGDSGDVLWNLGGRLADFAGAHDDGDATIADVHVVSSTDNGTSLFVLKNEIRSTANHKRQGSISRVEIDHTARTANWSAAFVHPAGIEAEVEGSIQQLESGRYLVSYGSIPVYSVYSLTGELLYDAHYGPIHSATPAFTGPPKQTYRVSQHPWKGYPQEPPQIKITRHQLFASWNGATELHAWGLDGRRIARLTPWIDLGLHVAEDYEIVISHGSDEYQEFRLTACDEDGAILAAWTVGETNRISVSHAARPHYLPDKWKLINSKGAVS